MKRRKKKIRGCSLAGGSRFKDTDASEECVLMPITVAGLAGGIAAGIAALIVSKTSAGSGITVIVPAVAGLTVGVLSGGFMARSKECFK